MKLTVPFILVAAVVLPATSFAPLHAQSVRVGRHVLNTQQMEKTPAPLEKSTTEKLVNSLADVIDSREREFPFRIAVFPFGDKGWDPKKPEHLTLRSIELQGAINSALLSGLKAKKTKNKFTLIDQFGLRREFDNASIDAVDISPNNAELPRLLKKLKIDAAIVGKVAMPDPVGPDQVKDFPQGKFNASIVFADEVGKKTDEVPGKLFGDGFDNAPIWQKRVQFGMECRVDPAAAWEPVPLIVDKTGPSDWYAVIKPRQAKGEYRILATNAGHDASDFFSYLGAIVNPDPAREKNRIFGIAVLIDGVNSFYQDTGAGKLGAVVVHPSEAKKWLLGPPGYIIYPGPGQKPWVKPAQGKDHASVAIAGFQNGEHRADTFKFAKVADLKGERVVAETLGISQSIGLISIFLFSRKLENDRLFAAAAAGDIPTLGTAAGRPFANPIVDMVVEFHPQPVHQLHINYRLEDEIPIPRENWKFLETYSR